MKKSYNEDQNYYNIYQQLKSNNNRSNRFKMININDINFQIQFLQIPTEE